MTARNDVTGDELKTGVNNNSYRNGWDRIFGRNQEKKKLIRKAKEFLEQSCIDVDKDEIKEFDINIDGQENTLVQIYLAISPESATDLYDRFVSQLVDQNYEFGSVSLTFVGTVLPE